MPTTTTAELLGAKAVSTTVEHVKLPIDVVPTPSGTPPRFRWTQLVDTLNGKKVVKHEGFLPGSVEVAVARLVTITKQLLMDNAALRGQVQGYADRIEAQQAEPETEVEPTAKPVNTSTGKRKG